MPDTREKLSRPTVTLHWLVAAGMVALVPMGLYIEGLPKSPERFEWISLHKSLAIILLVLAVLRFAWRLRNGFPVDLSPMARWQEVTARSVHWILLLGTLFMPISGIMMSIGGGYPIAVFGLELVAKSPDKIEALSEIGHVIHGIGGKLLIAAFLLHVAGALKHHLVDKDGTTRRMLGMRVEG